MIKGILPKGTLKGALLLMCLIASQSLESQNAVTCIHDWSGQLGDQLLMYINTKWFAYYFNLPFYYQPFPYIHAVVSAKSCAVSGGSLDSLARIIFIFQTLVF
jgi:hypothetical protein